LKNTQGKMIKFLERRKRVKMAAAQGMGRYKLDWWKI